MASIYRCDRCGDDCVRNSGEDPKTVKLATLGANVEGVPLGGTDLCGRCVAQLVRWLKEAPARVREVAASR